MNVEINSYADLRLDVLKFVYFLFFCHFILKVLGSIPNVLLAVVDG